VKIAFGRSFGRFLLLDAAFCPRGPSFDRGGCCSTVPDRDFNRPRAAFYAG
jgi:hypothetical protein